MIRAVPGEASGLFFMISVEVYYTRDGRPKGFRCLGHAGYAEPGQDIVCAAVSVLVINTANSIETLVPGEKPEIRSDRKTGLISCILKDDLSSEAELLLRSMLLGLKGIEEEYGSRFLQVYS